MTNWPNIQEYRNFEAKFFNSQDQFKVIEDNSSKFGEIETVIHQLNSNDWPGEIKNDETTISSPKRIRCVIKNDFEEAFKKLDRGDGLTVSQEHQYRPKQQDAVPVPNQSAVEKVRLQNHLKWKKQKEEEYQQRKEAEKAAQREKEEAEIKMEKMKKQKEKEREEKLRKWQEQKDREKEGKKREKRVLKVLEEELKGATPVIDKEKLIENWVRLKDRQKQMEAEKKAEFMKREEESKALRQNLAELSYKQWKERLKGKMVTLPKNGYQIFGPKPVPVVKEDWNHNFTSNSPRRNVIGLFNSKSNTTTSYSFQSGVKELENIKDILFMGDTKSRSPSFYRLKSSKSRLNIFDESESAMPLKELQPGTVGQKKTCQLKHGVEQVSLTRNSNNEASLWNRSVENNDIPDSLLHLPLNEEDQDYCLLSSGINRNSREQTGATRNLIKKKIDLYINPPLSNAEGNFRTKCAKKSTAINNLKPKERKNGTGSRLSSNDSKGKIVSQKSSGPFRTGPYRANSEAQVINKSANLGRDRRAIPPAQNPSSTKTKSKVCRRSRSYDKPIKKSSKESVKGKACTSSRSLTKLKGTREGESRASLMESNKTSQKKKVRKHVKPSTADRVVHIKTAEETGDPENDGKTKKKIKKKSSTSLTKSFSFTDSPYWTKKPAIKDRGKVIDRRKITKDGETKSDNAGQRRK